MRALDPIEQTSAWSVPLRRPTWRLGGVPRETLTPVPAAILFADIVGFTRLCEDLDPRTAFVLLTDFHARMAEVLADHRAAVADYIGDGVMAAWTGADGPDVAVGAFRCALAMLEAVGGWNRERAVRGGRAIRIGVGLNAGPVMIGRAGAPPHGKLGAFGDAVNVAHRLERMTRGLAADVVVSEPLFDAVAAAAPREAGRLAFAAARAVDVPGRAHGIRIRTAVAP